MQLQGSGERRLRKVALNRGGCDEEVAGLREVVGLLYATTP